MTSDVSGVKRVTKRVRKVKPAEAVAVEMEGEEVSAETLGLSDAGRGTTKKKAASTPTGGGMRPFDGADAGRVPVGFEVWLAGARALGLGPGELVWELHVVQGRCLPEVARLLGMPCAEAVALHATGRVRAAERAPKSEADFLAVREEVRERLVSIIEDASRAPEDPRLLAIRQRACDQMADLYGLKMQRRTGAESGAVTPYALPEEICAAVEERARDLFGRADEIAEAKRGLKGE